MQFYYVALPLQSCFWSSYKIQVVPKSPARASKALVSDLSTTKWELCVDLRKVQTKTQLLQQSLDVLPGSNCVGHIDNVLVLPGLKAYGNSESLMLFRWDSSL